MDTCVQLYTCNAKTTLPGLVHLGLDQPTAAHQNMSGEKPSSLTLAAGPAVPGVLSALHSQSWNHPTSLFITERVILVVVLGPRRRLSHRARRRRLRMEVVSVRVSGTVVNGTWYVVRGKY